MPAVSGQLLDKHDRCSRRQLGQIRFHARSLQFVLSP
jgi:hypothetical protein